jgi:acyl-CoA synthetase (AMP-forming)/AMP-acid ligase II
MGPSAFETAARQHGERTALIHRDGEVTYDDLAARVDVAAERLRGAGRSPGTPMILSMDNTVDSVVDFYAARQCGIVVVALSASAGRRDVDDAVARTSRLDQRAGPAGPDAPALVLFTSGTTSRPKGVVHSANTLGTAAENFVAAAELTPDDRLFLVSPLASITGILQALHMAPMLGAAVVLEDRFEPSSSLDLLLDGRGSFYGGPDVVLTRLFAAARDRGLDRVGLRKVSLGGTMLDPALLRAAEQEFDIRVTRAYGSSEAPFSTATPIADPVDARLGFDGVALPGVEITTGTKNDPSELAIRGPHLMLRYLDDDDNDEAFDDGWFCTGDIAEIADGGRIRIVGRIKDVAIRNGVKIALAEVELAVGALDGVDECVAYRVPDPQTGEHVGVAVVASKPLGLADVTGALRTVGVTTAKLPEELVVWSGPFPETATGKVQRAAVAERAKAMAKQVVARLET